MATQLTKGVGIIGTLKVNDDITVGDDLNVSGDLTITGDLPVTGQLGVNGTTPPAAQAAALTADAGTVTYTVTDTPDYALQTLTNTTPYGFATLGEAEGLVEVVKGLQTRVAELEAMLDAATGIGLCAAAA